jgi:hypothetical protein
MHLSERDKTHIRELHFESLRSIHRTAKRLGGGLPSYNRSDVAPISVPREVVLQCIGTLDSQDREFSGYSASLPCPFCTPYNLSVETPLVEIENWFLAQPVPTSFSEWTEPYRRLIA